MWTLDNIGEVLMRLGLFIVFPITSYILYSMTELEMNMMNIFMYIIVSSFVSVVITAFLSPFIMIASFIIEGFFNLFSKE